MDQRLANLQQWTRERYPSFTTAKYCWSGQVIEPVDFMPFSGRNPGSRNIYIHTGDSGQGITNGVAGSLTILPLIIGEHSRYAPVLEPSRKSLTSGPSLGEFVRGQAGVVHNLTEYITPSEVGSVDEIAAGEGAVLRQGAIKLACYKAEDGTIMRRSASCTHMACLSWLPLRSGRKGAQRSRSEAVSPNLLKPLSTKLSFRTSAVEPLACDGMYSA
jgi:hypothetical protein